ncbi:MAG TPA: ABC transporter ATP-binding protein [Conexibacter sp.]|nr:ABC transporter ATP-binding protein [Conexibacter sp.]
MSVLRFEGVWKAYRDWTQPPRTLRGALGGRTSLLGRRARRWALRDLTLELPAGGSLGVIGHNGAGKSTFLRLAAGLGRPTRGTLAVDPDTAAVLSLGSSFDQQLTGRENALTAALVAGMTRREAQARLPAMLDFADLGEFVASPVRTYSEGMKLRLAFGVMATLEPRLLILDEVLAVGDLAFRQKCQERIDELRAGGTSLLLASHSLDELRTACEQVVWLHRGGVRAIGDVETVLDDYERESIERTWERTPVGSARDEDGPLKLRENRFGSQEMTIEAVEVHGAVPDGPLRTGDPLHVHTTIVAAGAPVADPIVVVSLRRRGDQAIVFDLSTRADGVTLGRAVERADVTLTLDRLELPAGDYALDVGVFEAAWEHAYDYHWQTYPLTVVGPSGATGLVLPQHRWSSSAPG